ncbi:hypothetical protein CERZMDRAFT_63947 [Cercospora zeae-maydis SCOH1-5]|uniref:FAD dependent oxidoreductase domain-containing protein n=1 Tax=Cercospora zeae-maydis SCOH1-5 TaxID=717836 RepID=A0A6A6FWT7_9PEZI|nr:hypothetical protein CERZMDRAFT_63947 [Cercospora zeae-maydis SCOH1-5]
MAPHATGNPELASAGITDEQETITELKQQQGYRSLPLPNPCLSYWHRTTRAFKHLNANEEAPVPQSAKYVIIGSGLSGSLTAWSLVVDHGVPATDVLILEAREAVGGASGRNAGHVRPDAFRGFAAYSRIHGPEQAKKIIENEKLVFGRLDAFVREHNIPCDFNSTTTFDVCLTPEFVEYQKESFAAYRAAGGDVSHVQYYAGDVAKVKTGVESALAAYEWPAGSKRQAKWDVITARGTVASQIVVHCTNAYAAHLLPELSTFVTPNRAQAHSIVPGRELSGSNAHASTMSLRYGLKHFFSFIQRAVDGTVVFGVSRDNPTWSEATKSSTASFDDTKYNAEIAASSAKAYGGLFATNGPNSARHGEGVDHSWTGIIAMTPDSVPMVGALEGREGQFILAGHNGHGMARIWMCAPGLAKIIQGDSWSATGLPECFKYSKSRLIRATTQNVRSVW